jgi:hypothetical protein
MRLGVRTVQKGLGLSLECGRFVCISSQSCDGILVNSRVLQGL